MTGPTALEPSERTRVSKRGLCNPDSADPPRAGTVPRFVRATTVVVFACAIAACSFDWDRLSPAASGGAGGNATGGSAAGGAGGTSTGGSGGQGGDGGTAGDGGVGGTSDCGNGMLDAGEECDESNGTDACIECVVECRDYEVKNPATLTCYEVVGRATASWGDARNYCVDRGGDLTAFTGEAEYNFLAGILLVPGPYWIGATDVDEEGVYVWSSGEPFSYANWEDNEPTDDITVNLSEDCIDIFDDPMAGPLMGDNECINDSFWICERNPLVGQ